MWVRVFDPDGPSKARLGTNSELNHPGKRTILSVNNIHPPTKLPSHGERQPSLARRVRVKGPDPHKQPGATPGSREQAHESGRGQVGGEEIGVFQSCSTA